MRFNTNISRVIKSDLLARLYDAGPDGDYLELVISMEKTKLNVKELSSYLEFVYRIDGFLGNLSFFKYSHAPQAQIEIDEIRLGSWEIVIRELFTSGRAEKLIFIGLCLKYLPQILNSFMDIGLKYMDIKVRNEDYLEKKERREFRKDIRESITNDDLLSPLDKKAKEAIVDVLDELYIKNKNQIPASSRFASKSVKSVKLNRKK
jgi:hypothetical protein